MCVYSLPFYFLYIDFIYVLFIYSLYIYIFIFLYFYKYFTLFFMFLEMQEAAHPRGKDARVQGYQIKPQAPGGPQQDPADRLWYLHPCTEEEAQQGAQ